jgi:glycosyltransferase involved in cell wall biosynthesis
VRIGIDASRAISAEPTGVENYSLELVRELLRQSAQDSEREIVLYAREHPAPGLLPEEAKFDLRVIPFPRLWTHVRLSWETFWHRPDVLFVPGHVIPLVHPDSVVVTIHDLGHLHYPEAYPAGTLRYLRWSTEHNIRAASHLLADSEATRGDLEKFFSVPVDRITVVYPGLRRGCTAPRQGSEVLHEYGIDGPYVLYVGTLQPRKNVERLIEAFALAKRKGHIKERLVLAGRIGWLPEGIMRRLQEVGDTVTLAGYVPDDHLPALYAGATLFVLPSLFEGFGMPVVEAMACGAPVLAADTSSLPEVVGDAGLLFDPLDTEALADAIVWLCEHESVRQELRDKGLKRAAAFTWEEAARKTLEVLDRVARA